MTRRSVQLSLIVPLRLERGSVRERSWRWLRQYWAHELPDAEVVIGRSSGPVFSKTRAVNDAVRRSRGRILCVIDADAYLPGYVIQACADRLEIDLSRGVRRWFIPYTALYRLTEEASSVVLGSSPLDPYRLPSPPPDEWVESTVGSLHGRRYGAMIVIYPREAFDLLGGMDPRFEGWGGEDIAFARALDTLYAKHKTTPNDVNHIWHPKIGDSYVTRTWAGQEDGVQLNSHLASRYSHATGDRVMMRGLVDEGIAYGQEHPDGSWWRRAADAVRDWLSP